jgi:hypothetical protein
MKTIRETFISNSVALVTLGANNLSNCLKIAKFNSSGVNHSNQPIPVMKKIIYICVIDYGIMKIEERAHLVHMFNIFSLEPFSSLL